MKVSVVVINHNYASYLAEAIDSALAQTKNNTEVVVVDDGSTDESRTLLATYGDRVKLVLRDQGGHVAACNSGFAASTGELVVFLDADDKLYPGCFEAVMGVWRPDASKVQYRLDTIDKDGVDQDMPFPYFRPELTPAEIRRQALRHGTYPWTVSSGNAYSRRFLEQIMPIDAARVFKSPDGYFNKLAPLYGDVLTLDRVLGAYRVHGANAWAQRADKIQLNGISRTIALDVVLNEEFARRAKALGIAAEDPPMPVPQQLEGRILMRRLEPKTPPAFAGDSIRRLWPLALRSVVAAPNMGGSGRLFWAGWLTLLALAPRAMIGPLYTSARAQTGRKALFKWLIAATRRPRASAS